MPDAAILSHPAPKRAFSSLSAPFCTAGKTYSKPRNKKSAQNKPCTKRGGIE
jgi:hypothetical protein